MSDEKRIGLWMIGAYGGVATTSALGLAALARGFPADGLITAMPEFQELGLDAPSQFIVGGHDIRHSSFAESVKSLQHRSNIFDPGVVEACRLELEKWNENVRPGTILNTGSTIAKLVDHPGALQPPTARDAIECIKRDLENFRDANKLNQVVVINLASTEPPFETGAEHDSIASLDPLLDRTGPSPLPASSIYAWAAMDLGLCYINFTPSLGASVPALHELAMERNAVYCGKDAKTGETLMKTVLAPMFAFRNLKVLSWVGHNIFGNRDGIVLSDPINKASKVRSKDEVLASILGYKPQSLVSIEYIESLDDWKTAWDHIHFQGFLGTKMMLQFTWQGCDSILAAPLALDTSRLALFSQSRGEVGLLKHLACFFKSPTGVDEHNFFHQYEMLSNYLKDVANETHN